MIKSYWGFGAFSSTYIISGSNRVDLEEENSGKINSTSPVSKVVNSPLDVCHICGTNFFLAFMCEFFLFFLQKNKSASEPLSNKTLSIFGLRVLFLTSRLYTIAPMLVHRPCPKTIFACFLLFSTTLIGRGIFLIKFRTFF